MGISDDVKQKAIELGFDAVGITDALAIDSGHVEALRGWLKAGFTGQMNYMHRNFDKRIEPAKLLTGAQSVIVCALNIKPREEAIIQKGQKGRIAIYARYEDYHIFIKKLLQRIADFIAASVEESVKFKICVDSVPLAERAIAQRAGVGFIGKSHNLIHPEAGPAILLGEIITTVLLAPDEPLKLNCKGCNKCIEACPTGALRADGRFDATKCISYLTIEHKGDIDRDIAGKIGDRLFGCDECVVVCPYYQKAPYCRNKEIKFEPQRGCLDLKAILDMNEDDFKREFKWTVIERTGLESMKRNAERIQNTEFRIQETEEF